MKLTAIRKIGRFKNNKTGQIYNVLKGERKGYGTSHYYWTFRGKRTFISDRDFFDKNIHQKVEPKIPMPDIRRGQQARRDDVILSVDERLSSFLSLVGDHVQTRFKSKEALCRETSMDSADISRFLSGRSEWGIRKVIRLLAICGYELDTKKNHQ